MKMRVMVWHTLYMLWRDSSDDDLSIPNMPHRSSSDRHHAGHRGEEVVHLFATGAWTHDLCDGCCVICHADDSYYSGAAVVLTDMMHCSSSTTFHHPPSTIIRAADQRLARLHVVHSALRADRGVGLAALGPGPYCLAGEILLGGVL